MKVFAAALLMCSTLAISAQTEPPAPSRITVTVNTQQTMDPVSRYEYGMFIEHIRDTMYRGLWSELLEDRKFYFPISSAAPVAPPQQQAGGPPRGPQPRRWLPVGPDEAITMDKDKPFVGDQSPRIALDASTEHGIRESGIALQKGKRYIGHIILRGTPGAHIKVALVWGNDPNDRRVISLNAVPQTYKTFPLNFTAPADSSDAALEITGTGTGDFTCWFDPIDARRRHTRQTRPTFRRGFEQWSALLQFGFPFSVGPYPTPVARFRALARRTRFRNRGALRIFGNAAMAAGWPVVSARYTPVVIAVAALTAVVPPLGFGADWVTWIYRGLALLLIGCPCALVLSTPAAITAGIAAGARRGLLIKGGAALETIGRVTTVAFDKTGTLTLGKPHVTDVLALSGSLSAACSAWPLRWKRDRAIRSPGRSWPGLRRMAFRCAQSALRPPCPARQ